MNHYQPLNVLPPDIQMDFRTGLEKATPTDKGVFRLMGIRRTKPKSFEEQRVVVLVVDENGFPMPGVRVAFAYSTAPDFHLLTPDFRWIPPEQRAFIVPTAGGGQIDQIQGSAIGEGRPGGITVFLWEPEYSCDVVTGAGMLADHTGMHLTFQLRRTGVTPLLDRLANIEARLAALEAGR
jgi:hypothetical protein